MPDSVDYREYSPPEPLRRHVQCLWRLRSLQCGPQTIFPDGRCELVVHLGPPPLVWGATDGWREQARVVFAGQYRSAIRLDPRGVLYCVGVRLTPAASAALLPMRLIGLRDRMLDLSRSAPEFAAAVHAAADRFVAAPESSNLWDLLGPRLIAYPIDERIESVVARMESSGGQGRIAQFAAATGMSLRSFQLRFVECVGLTAKEFARVLRLQATIRALDRELESLSQMAQSLGFSDQAHATRELTRLTGATPATLRAALRRERDGDETIRLAAAFVRGRSSA